MNGTKIVYIILWLVLIGVAIFTGQLQKNQEMEEAITQVSPTPSATPIVSTGSQDIRGVWISYISLENELGTKESFEELFNSYIDKAIKHDITDLFVHVRPFSDALYRSEYYPWSHLLTGTQGVDPQFDPMEYMIDVAHENGMKFHAWINPLRIKLPTIPDVLSSQNPYNIYVDEKPYFFFEKDGAIYINPAYSDMRTLIADGVAEIVRNYDVDGIHFDDYFYPEDMQELDIESYELYVETASNPLGIEEWRETNINALIAQVYRAIENENGDVVFGISPQGNPQNNQKLSADVITWCATKGYIDYICPQIYFSYNNPVLGFEESLTWWLTIPKHEDLLLYIGLAAYKVGSEDDGGTWLTDENVIERQMEQSEETADGYVLYEISWLVD